MLKFLAGLAAPSLLSLALLTAPAAAQTCISYDALMAQTKGVGDTIAGDLTLPGDQVDRLIVDVDADGVWLWLMKDGCVVARPINLGPPVGSHTAPAAKPKLQGSGLELGV